MGERMAATKISANTQEELQRIAAELVPTLEMPSLVYGQGMYINLASFDFEKTIGLLREQKASFLKIEADSPVIISTLREQSPAFIQQYATALIFPAENKLIAAQYAFVPTVHVVIVPRGVVVAKPIVIENTAILPAQAESILFVFEEGATATVIERQTSSSANQFGSQMIQIHLHPQAHVRYYTIQDHADFTHTFITKRAVLDHDASLTWIDALAGGKFTQFALKNILQGEGATATTYTLYSGDGGQIFDLNTETMHQGKHTKGMMKARGVLDGHAKTVYRRTVSISPSSPGAIAQQKSETLLMGEHASCDAVPVLDVHHHDVVCSHGAALGQISEESLFYVMSRGLDLATAKRIIIEGFLGEYLREMSEIYLQNEIKTVLSKRGGSVEN